MLQEIPLDEALGTAMNMVSSARASIRMTMRATEETENPIPDAYFELLRQRIEEGVHVTRIGFGSQKEFLLLEHRVKSDAPNYAFYRTDESDYRRMLLVDGARLLFAKDTDIGRQVFYTEDSEIIRAYEQYFTARRGAIDGKES